MKAPLTSTLALVILSSALPLRAEDAPKPAPAPVQPAPVAPAPPAAPGTPAAKDTFEALQGVWEGVELGHESDGACVVTITGDAMHFQRGRGKAWHKAVLEVPAGTPTGQIRATIKESSATNFVGQGAALLYKIAPDGTLILSGGRPGEAYVPKGFEEDEHSRRFVLKKALPKTPAPPAT